MAPSWLGSLDISNSFIDEACHSPKLCNGYKTSGDGGFVGVPEFSVICRSPSAANLRTIYMCVCMYVGLCEIYHSPNSVSEGSAFSQDSDKLQSTIDFGVCMRLCRCWVFSKVWKASLNKL